MAEKKGMARLCPGCGERLEGLTTDWTYTEKTVAGHRVLTMGTAWNAALDIVGAVKFQIAANEAAYDLDWDHKLNFGFLGAGWVQCPEARDRVGLVAAERGTR